MGFVRAPVVGTFRMRPVLIGFVVARAEGCGPPDGRAVLVYVTTAITSVIAKFHYTGPTGPDQTKSADFVGDPGLRPGSREKVRAGPRGSGRVRVVEFSLYCATHTRHGTGSHFDDDPVTR